MAGLITEPLNVAIDFDDTIAPSNYPDLPEAPYPGAKRRLLSYRRAGFRIIIYTVRTNPVHVDWYEQVLKLRGWLTYHGIPFDYVSADGKPPADVYIDDKAYRFDRNCWSWDDPGLSPTRLLSKYGGHTQGYAAGAERRVADRKPDGSVWIGLAGKMGAGKDTVATVLAGLYGEAYVRGFAAGVKDKARAQGIDPTVKTPSVRATLQEIGQGERERQADYWIQRYWEWAKAAPDFPHVNLIVDDVRYPNEVEFLRSKGFRVGFIEVPEQVRMVRLLRRDGAIPYGRFDHESETALDNYEGWDFTIHNYTVTDALEASKILEAAADAAAKDATWLAPVRTDPNYVRPDPNHSCARGMDCPLYDRGV